jgi:hypothetical protein
MNPSTKSPPPSQPSGTIELHVRALTQLYNSMDPSPFHERDLDPGAEEFILGWAQELPADVPIDVAIYADELPRENQYLSIVTDAIHTHFSRLSQASRRQLRQLLKDGRTSLLIGLSCLVASVFGGEMIVRAMSDATTALVIRESLLIGGWVAMWRPIEIFLYERWPIRNRRRILDRLGKARVEVIHDSHTA